MSIPCPVCGYENNPADAEFCETCGAELNTPSPAPVPIPSSSPPPPSPQPTVTVGVVTSPPSPPVPSPTITPPPPPTVPPSPTVTPPVSPPTPTIANPSTGTTARLIAKLPNAPVAEYSINGSALIGIFTPESGPVDIDLEAFPGNETISKQHAEILYENGGWIIKDSSTNGTYIKPAGQTRFGARIMAPTPINSGDQIAFAKVIFLFETS